jgi:predicted dehydrogenase
MPSLRIGIIGTQFAARLHLNNYKPLQGAKVEILAVASRTKGSAAELAKKFGIPQVVDDYRHGARNSRVATFSSMVCGLGYRSLSRCLTT